MTNAAAASRVSTIKKREICQSKHAMAVKTLDTMQERRQQKDPLTPSLFKPPFSMEHSGTHALLLQDIFELRSITFLNSPCRSQKANATNIARCAVTAIRDKGVTSLTWGNSDALKL
jgi:hypothetical protein